MAKQFRYIGLLALLLLVSCKDQQTTTTTSSLVDVTKAKELLDSKSVIALDVRTPYEIKNGKIKDALELDFKAEGFKEKLDAFDKSKSYLVYCRSGGRSAKSIKLMSNLGFSNTYDLEGGYTAWSNTYGNN